LPRRKPATFCPKLAVPERMRAISEKAQRAHPGNENSCAMSYSKLGAHLAIADISNLTFENSKSDFETRNSTNQPSKKFKTGRLSGNIWKLRICFGFPSSELGMLGCNRFVFHLASGSEHAFARAVAPDREADE
jgi:hypothetical protein